MLDLEKRAEEIRNKLIQTVSERGGHLAPNLGVVELTLALHEVFDFQVDKLLFDVGHQSYVHKIITDREEKFSSLRQRGGLGPFQDPQESSWDSFISGHAGTALAAGVGIAKAYPEKKIVVVLGDAAMANGHSMEALNYIGGEKLQNMIVILNDNGMSIGNNVGFLSKLLGRVMMSPSYFSLRHDIRNFVDKIQANALKEVLERMEISVKNFLFPSNVAENFGYLFLGSVDGHNLKDLISTFQKAKNMKGPVFIHVKTQKGKGYVFAEENQEKFHGIAPFDIRTGEVNSSSRSYSSIFGQKIEELAEQEEDIFAITAGMLSGVGLKSFAKKFPDRVIDTGIAEGFATTMAAGLSISKKKSYLCLYSTFLQRSFSQVIHDIALQNLPVRFIIDRVGLVGEDGKTHHGLHDLQFLLSLSNIEVLMPSCGEDLEEMLEFSKDYEKGPLAIRIPRALAHSYPRKETWTFGTWQEVQEGQKNLFLALGTMVKELQELQVEGKILSVSSLQTWDETKVLTLLQDYENVFICEESYQGSSFYKHFLYRLGEKIDSRKIHSIALEEFSIPHGERIGLLEEYGLRGTRLLQSIEEKLHGRKE